jgi:murein DD-endopeptidase MepM/ murein hydrolase activator NlpD
VPSTLCGIDFIDRIGKPDLLAMADGVVEYVHDYNPKYKWGGGNEGWDTLGRFVVIRCIADGVTVWLRYCHCERVDVKAGDTVTAGQCIGIYGDTGASHGAHVHVDAWVAWGAVGVATQIGLVAEGGLRLVKPWPGCTQILYNVNPTKFFASQKLDVVNTGGTAWIF